MSTRKIKLIRNILANENISTAELMEKLDISQRTLRSEIKEVNNLLSQYDVYIHSANKGGYHIYEQDKPFFQTLLNQLIEQRQNVLLPETPDERFLFGIIYVFFSKEYTSIQKLSEKLYISKTAMLETKKLFQQTIKLFPSLKLEVGLKGIYIHGDEANKRHVISEILNYRTYGSILLRKVLIFMFGEQKYNTYCKIYEFLQHELYEYGYRLNDKSIEGFAIDIFISILRTEYGFLVKPQYLYENLDVIEKILSFVKSLGYDLSDNDKIYITECFQAKRSFFIQNSKVKQITIDITDRFLKNIDEKYNTSFTNNTELKNKLAVHIEYMLERIKQGHFETNPALYDIENSYPLEFEMATHINDIICDGYANDHEIAYLAIYIRAYSQKQLTAIILSDIGQGVADNMERQIKQYCGEKIEIIGKMSLVEYRQRMINVDMLISGSRIFGLKLKNDTKIFYVNYILKDKDLKKIQEYILTKM